MSESREMNQAASERRDARRTPMQTLLRYREIGNADWSEGVTENISRSGILFRGRQMGEARAALEMVVIFPETADGPGGRALCSGHIVRMVSRDGSAASFAARISSCRIVGRLAKDASAWAEWSNVIAPEV